MKEDTAAALGAGAGDGVEIEHTVRGWRTITKEYQRMRERVRGSKSAPLCCVLFISQTHHCTGEQGPGEKRRRGME